jgi:hypothetical protein
MNDDRGLYAEVGDRCLSLDRLFLDEGDVRDLPRALMARWVVWNGPADGERTVANVVEAPATWLVADDWRPIPDRSHPHARAARATWRAAAATAGARALEEESLFTDELLPPILPQDLIRTWVADGPPGPRPQWTPLDVERPLRPGERLEPVDVDDPRVVAAFSVAGWQVRLTAYLEQPGRFWADTVSIVSPEGDEVIVAMNDPWNPPAWGTVDGDPPRFRAFSDWLVSAIRASGLDRDLHYHPPDDDLADEENEGDVVPLTRWLLCYDRYREDVLRQPLIDWRLQPDRVAAWRFWENGIYGLDADTRRAHEDGIATWHRFLDTLVRRPA